MKHDFHIEARLGIRIFLAMVCISAIVIVFVLARALDHRATQSCDAINDGREHGVTRALLLTRMINQENKPGKADDGEILAMLLLVSDGILPPVDC